MNILMKDPKIVILAGENEATTWVYNFIASYFKIEKLIIEKKEDKLLFLRRRINRLGLLTVFGQVLFSIFCYFIRFFSIKRRTEIINLFHFSSKEIPSNLILRVTSVNNQKTLELLNQCTPDIVLVFGTRIISSRVLNGCKSVFINIHAGITPKYRGVHGAYWALVNGDFNNCGVTLHYVDKGIDTGNVISQKVFIPTSRDNFTTYPLLQLGEGLALLKIFLDQYKSGTQESFSHNEFNESQLWYHPTLWFYLRNYMCNRIK
jgi:hypothetical protein